MLPNRKKDNPFGGGFNGGFGGGGFGGGMFGDPQQVGVGGFLATQIGGEGDLHNDSTNEGVKKQLSHTEITATGTLEICF